MIHILPAFEKPKFLFGMLGVSISLSLIMILIFPYAEALIYKLFSKIEKKVK